MKKIEKFTINENIDPLSEYELKTIVGGYSTSACSTHSSSCSGSCTTQTGASGTCGGYYHQGTKLCACYA